MATERGRRPVRLWQVAAMAIVIVGTLGIGAGTWTWYHRNQDQNRAEFEANADQVVVTTKKTLDGYGNQIASAVALFTQPGLIDRTEFHSYVRYLDLYNRYKGIYGLGLISWVPAPALPSFVAGWRADGDPGFTVAPVGNRPAYCLVSQFDEKKLVSGVPLVGFDLCTIPKLVTVLDAAAADGMVHAVPETSIAAAPAYEGNFVVVAPVYSGDPVTLSQRQAQRTGWVATLVNGAQLLKAALGPDNAHVGVEMFSGSRVSAKQLVVSSPSDLKARAPGSVIEHFSDDGTWTLVISPAPGGSAQANPLVGPLAVFVMSLVLILALAAFVWDLGRGRLRARRLFTQSETRFQSLASSSPVGIIEFTRDGTMQYVNRVLNEIVGVDDAFWLDHKWFDCILPEDRQTVMADAETAWSTRSDLNAGFRVLQPSGEVRNVRLMAAPVTIGTEEPSTFVASAKDVTEDVAATEDLAFRAMHDSLTGLPNRALFLDRLEVELAHMARAGSDLAVMFLDLDGFKAVNDGMGHEAGDELLKAVAVNLRRVVRAGETVARLGGDEFTFIFHDVDGVDKASVVAQRILGALSRPIAIDGRTTVVTGSVGVVLPGPGAQAAAVLRDADAGMYRAKESGRDRFEIFVGEGHAAPV